MTEIFCDHKSSMSINHRTRVTQLLPDDDNDFEEQYIEADEVLAEVPDIEDRPMDEDEDDEHDEVAAHPTQALAATGGEDDLGYIWNTSNGDIIAKLTGHTDSVTSIAFSHDGEMLSTGGMDGKVRIWRRVGKEHWKTWEFLTELQGPDEVMVSTTMWFCESLSIKTFDFVVPEMASEGKRITCWVARRYRLAMAAYVYPSSYISHSGPVQCGEFTPDGTTHKHRPLPTIFNTHLGKRIITACSGGDLIYWDPRSDTPIFKRQNSEGKFSVGEVTCTAINPSSTIVVVGGSNGLTRISASPRATSLRL
ncbi:Ribosome biogenesis protein [Salix suchowensis]|nr:Ribosome biogenesis protein [Salix suchowensis]